MKGRQKASVLSDGLEALIGAIYLELGYENVAKFIEKHIYQHVDSIDTQTVKSYKTLVQELVQKDYKTIPQYYDKESKTSSSGNVELYQSEMYIADKKQAEGFGISKKKAQEDAAKNFRTQQQKNKEVN